MKILNFIRSFPGVKRRNDNWEKASELVLEIAKMNKKLAEDAAVFKAIFCVSPIVMLVVGLEDGVIHEANRLFEEYSKYTRDEVLGKTIYELKFYYNPEEREDVIKEIKEKRSIKNKALSFVMKNGEVKRGLLSSKIITKDEKECLFSVIMDTTELDMLRDQRIGNCSKIEHDMSRLECFDEIKDQPIL